MDKAELFDQTKEEDIIQKLNIKNYINELNTLYSTTKLYLDNNFHTQIKIDKYHFHQKWFEMYLIERLLSSKVNLVKPPKAGGRPDIGIEINNEIKIWIECVSPKLEKDQDNHKKNEDGSINFDYILPRITSAVKEKIKQNKKHRKNVVKENDFVILAINVDLISKSIPDKFLGIFEGWKDTYVCFHPNDEVTTINPKCERIIKPSTGSEISIDFFNDVNFLFDVVLFSSSSLGVCINPEFKCVSNKNTDFGKFFDDIKNIIDIIIKSK